jgi:cobyrinic acid a,c-diamide synthase
MNGFIVAGTNSGCGKTTITIGLMALLAKHGYKIAPFKTGPDYIDPAFHEMATGAPSYNLDSYLVNHKTLQYLYSRHSQSEKIAIIEGVMGLYDGLGPDSLGSTAELSHILRLPVILVVNCNSLYQSVAAIVTGFAQIDHRINVKGVFLNNIPNAESYQFLKKLIETKTGIACVGYLPFSKGISLESRHLGLVQAQETANLKKRIALLTDILKETTDIHKLLEIASFAKKAPSASDAITPWQRDLKGLKLAVAQDKAFSFYYRDNLELLEDNGAELIPFSPLCDVALPNNANAVYIGGGYPEIFADGLSSNRQMLSSLNIAVQQGIPVYAECGGLMYLTSAIDTSDGHNHPMAGIFKCSTKMQKRLQNFGYCEVNWQGTTTKAHEFHHSSLIMNERYEEFELQFKIRKPLGDQSWEGGLRYKNALAGYPHVHFYSSPEFYHKLIDLWTTNL